MNGEIPKIIHQIWIQGFNNIPSKYQQCLNSVRNLKIFGYDIMEWDNINIYNIILKHIPIFADIYTKTTRYDQKSDIARVVLMYIFGGYYLDVDISIELGKDLVNLDVPREKTLIFMRTPVDIFDFLTLQNSFLASAPKQIYWKIAMKEMLFQYQKHSEAGKSANWFSISSTTGSKVLMKSLDKYKKITKLKYDHIHYIRYPYCCSLFSYKGDYLLDNPNTKTVFTVNQNLASNHNSVYRIAILYSKVRKGRYIFAIIFTSLLILVYLLYKLHQPQL